MVGNEQEKQQKKKKNKVPFRLNVLFIIVFLLFSVLILRLGIVQIVNGEEHKKDAQETEEKVSRLDAARGLIYDRYGRLLVGNERQNAITFTRTKDDSPQDLLDLARKLSNYITMDKDAIDKVTERDKKDYWILKRGYEQAYDLKLSEAELKRAEQSEDGNAAYELLLKRITKKDLDAIGKQEMQVVAIWRKLNQAMNLTPFIVKKGVKKEAFFKVGSNLENLNGIDVTVDSTRVYPKGHEFYLGSVGSIPHGKLDYYLVRGYNRNDEVGTSYLEQYYEDVLNGIPTTMKYVKGSTGDSLTEPQRIEGRRGYDMVLTINIKLQHKIQEILKHYLRQGMSNPNNPYLDDAYVVVADPNTGGILSLNGVVYENGEFHDASYKTVTSAFAIGSNIKGATVLAGFETNTIPGAFNDQPIHMSNDIFSSYPGNRIGLVGGPAQALEASSNTYMGKIALNMAGMKTKDVGYYYEVPTVFQPYSDSVVHAFRKLRHVYSQFGLGVQTGIDLPSEGLGYEGSIPPPNTGLLVRYAIGQYDTYTPIMLAQYFSTIANGGYRMQLHLLKSIREPAVKSDNVGEIVHQYQPDVLNHISMSDEALNTVQRGFWLVTHGGFHPTAEQLGAAPCTQYQIAGKTGTADIDYNHDGDLTEIDTVNELFSGYAPADDPEVVVTVVVPGDEQGKHHIKIAGRVFQTYFELKNNEQGKGEFERCPDPGKF